MALGLNYYLDEVRYSVNKTIRVVQGKLAQFAIRMSMGGGAAAVATKFSAPFRDALNLNPLQGATGAAVTTGEMVASAAGGFVATGLGIGIDVYQNQMDFRQSERQLTELYRPQIASIVGKDRSLVTVPDLYQVAENNPTLKEELDQHRHTRNVKNTAAIVGSAVAFTAVFAAIALFPPLGALAASASAAGFFSGAGLAFAASAGAIGFASFQTARRAVRGIGSKIFGLGELSTEDLVHKLSKQHRKEVTITPQQVLGVFESAQPEISDAIKEQYGKDYLDMNQNEKRAVAQQYEHSLSLTSVANALNHDQLNVRELVFMVHGQFSGVYPDPSLGDVLKQRAAMAGDVIQDKFVDIRHGVANKVDDIQDWHQARQESKLQDKVAKALEDGKELPEEALERAPETKWRTIIEAERQKKALQQERGAEPGIG